MISFYEIIKKIEKRPSLYLNKHSLSHLKTFLDGYTFALRQANISITEEEEKFETFQEWIEQKYNQHSTQDWSKIILFYAEDEADALDIFFELFQEFISGKTTNNNQLNKDYLTA